MDNQLLAQLERRLAEHYEHLCQRLDDIEEHLSQVQQVQSGRMDAHEAYHATHEHRWGGIALAGRYPFRLALVVAMSVWLLAGGGEGSLVLRALLHGLASIFQG